MRNHRAFLLVAVAALLIYAWTLTESVYVNIFVTAGRCTAELYGRGSTIDCPGLPGGSLVASHVKNTDGNHGSLLPGWLLPESAWQDVTLTSGDGRALPPATELPASFTVAGRLLRPASPGLLVLRRPGEDTGWAFVIDAANRRGAWWTWANGQPATPLQGVPLDQPSLARAKPLARQLLLGWQGALVLTFVVWLVARAGRWADAARFRERRSAASPPESHVPDRPRWSLRDKWSWYGLLVVIRRRGVVRWVLVGLILFSFTTTLYVSLHVLERAPHVQDELTYLFQAQTLARGRVYAPAPPLAGPEAAPHFAQEFLLVRDGRWFGKYPPGYPAVLALGVVAGGHWLVNPLLAALTVPLLWRLARALYRNDRRPGTAGPLKRAPRTDQPAAEQESLLAPLLLSLSPFVVVMSGSLMAHAAELFWITLFMLGWVQLGRRHGWRWPIIAGAAWGMLFLTRQYSAVLVAIGFALPWLGFMARRGRARSHSFQRPGSPAPLRPVVPLLLFALAAAPLVLVLPAHQAALTGDPRADPRLLYWPHDHLGFGPGAGEPENAFTFAATAAGPGITWHTDPAEPPRGHTPARGLHNLGRSLDALQSDLFGWPALFTLAFIWLAFLLRRPAAADWALLALLLAFAGGYVAYWHAGIAYGPRYFYAALPALLILTARGASALAYGGRPTLAVALVLLLLVGYNLMTLPFHIESYRGYNFIHGTERAAVETAVTTPSLVFVAPDTADWWVYGAFFSGNTPWLDGPVVYARDLGRGENRRLRAEFPGHAAYLWRDGQLTRLGPSVAGRPAGD